MIVVVVIVDNVFLNVDIGICDACPDTPCCSFFFSKILVNAGKSLTTFDSLD